jgi:large-conductance mechanosensitive channel
MTQTPPTPEERRAKAVRLVEDAFILLCILTLWPVILGWSGTIYEVLLYVALAGLVFIFIRRMRRFRASREELENNAAQPPSESQ